MKALVAAFNQEKALVGAFSVIVQPVVEPMDRFTALGVTVRLCSGEEAGGARRPPGPGTRQGQELHQEVPAAGVPRGHARQVQGDCGDCGDHYDDHVLHPQVGGAPLLGDENPARDRAGDGADQTGDPADQTQQVHRRDRGV